VGVLDLAEELAADGVATVLYTDVSRDGTSSGAALEETAAVASLVPTIASGGVRGAGDVVALSKIGGVVGSGWWWDGRFTKGWSRSESWSRLQKVHDLRAVGCSNFARNHPFAGSSVASELQPRG
jgi:hypothetical protein